MSAEAQMTEQADTEDSLSSVEKLARIEDQTNPDGTVDVEVREWREIGDAEAIEVDFYTPTNKVATEKMDFPEAGEDLSDFKFSRVLREAGLNLHSADMLAGESVLAERVVDVEVDGVDTGWKLVGDPPTEEEQVPLHRVAAAELRSLIAGVSLQKVFDIFVAILGIIIFLTISGALVVTLLG